MAIVVDPTPVSAGQPRFGVLTFVSVLNYLDRRVLEKNRESK
jgi:hypothetical protein